MQAWRRENEAREQAAGERGRTYSPQQLAEQFTARMAEPPRRPWWQEYRERHGEPRTGGKTARPTSLITRVFEQSDAVRANGQMRLLTDGLPVTLEEAAALGIYSAATSSDDGDGARLRSFQELAEAMGLEQAEIDAAIQAARR